MFTPEHAVALFTVCFLIILWISEQEWRDRRKTERMLRKYIRIEARQAEEERERERFVKTLREEAGK